MRNTFIFSLIVTIIFSSFDIKKEAMIFFQKDGVTALDTHKWYLTTIYKTNGYTQVLIRKAFISFNTTDGRISGNGSCNSFGGKLTVDSSGISFGNIFSTKMYCNDVQSIENDFFSRLSKVTRYEIRGNKLLLFEGDELVLEFEAG
ncbi:MAG TPA: META domain-containing protein [Chitinophagaceae bacterium]